MTLSLQTGLPEEILLALTDFVQWTLITLSERALLRLTVLLGQTLPTLKGQLLLIGQKLKRSSPEIRI